MKRVLLTGAVLMAVLMLPAMALATHVTEMVAMGDCEGFMAEVDVHFRSTADFFDLHYEVVVMDMDSNEVVMVSGDMNVPQEDMQDVTVLVSDMWNMPLDGYFLVSGTITITSPYPGGVDEDMVTFENEIECGSVANEALSLESLKAQYR